MTKKEIEIAGSWARKVSNINKEISGLTEIIQQLNSAKDGLKAIDYSLQRVSKSKAANPDEYMFNNIFRYEKQLQAYKDKIELLTSEQLDFIECVAGLEPTLNKLLMYRYISGMEWRTIAANLLYDETYTRGRLHQRALQALYEVMPIVYKE